MNIIERLENVVSKQLINKNVETKNVVFIISKDVDESLCKYLNKNIIGNIKLKTSNKLQLNILTYTIHVVVDNKKENNSIICVTNGYY